MEASYWKKCSNCKKEIPFGTDYYKCSVSTCNHERTGLQFCSVSCWSAHVPIYRHRDSWALEEKSPATAASVIRVDPKNLVAPKAPAYSSSGSATQGFSQPVKTTPSELDTDILIVVSKLKAFIKNHSDMNVSADVMDVLSDQLRRLALQAIQKARADGRKTVMGRDF